MDIAKIPQHICYVLLTLSEAFGMFDSGSGFPKMAIGYCILNLE